MTDRPPFLEDLVRELVKLPREMEWVEFKRGNDDPQEIGEYISALANAAALAGKSKGFLLWGIHNEDRAIVGTTVDPKAAKKGNEELESWLLHLLNPRIEFRFDEVVVDGQRVVVLEVERAAHRPVAFRGTEYVRVGTCKKKLKEYPEKERALWHIFDRPPFEAGVAAEHLSDTDAIAALDYPAYFKLMQSPQPDGRAAILDALRRDKLVVPCESGGWNITSLGATLFARRLDDFPALRRKAARVIQ